MAKITEEAVEFWEKYHFSLQMIAEVFGVSRQAVKKYLNRRGIDTGRNGGVEVECDSCGLVFKKARSNVRNCLKHYCSTQCYVKAIKKSGYIENRHSCRKARHVVRQFLGLLPENVVHHIDSDQANNDPSNLMVFANQSDHMRWHRAGQEKSGVVPLWSGKIEG